MQSCYWRKCLLPFLIVSFLYSFKNNTDSQVERSLKLAGNNRKELEKVLLHYKDRKEDKLKLNAAKFLIANMDEHFFYTSEGLDKYYTKLDSVFRLTPTFDHNTREQDSLLGVLWQTKITNLKFCSDLHYMTSDVLINNIDQAFEAWKSPFAKGLSFKDFCEYLLPYRVEYEGIDDWRLDYKKHILSHLGFLIDTTCNINKGLITGLQSIKSKHFSIPKEILNDTRDITLSFKLNISDYKDALWFIRLFGIRKELLPLKEWIHISVSFSEDYFILFINGKLIKKDNIRINREELLTNPIENIDDIHIYDRILNFREIAYLAEKDGYPATPEEIHKEIAWKIKDMYSHMRLIYEQMFYGGYKPSILLNMKRGECNSFSILTTYIFRSIGIPAGIDFTPQWANRSLGHNWNVLYTPDGKMADYSIGARWEPTGMHLKNRKEKKSKVFRKTYGKQKDTPGMYRQDEDIPDLFISPCIKDVTEEYLDCVDVEVAITIQPPKTKKFAYLCTFNNEEWIPVNWGKIEKNKIRFKKMGKDIVYLPVYYHNRQLLPASEPFILTNEGNVEIVKPGIRKDQQLILKRKFTEEKVKGRGEMLVGSRFQVANKLDFSDSITVHKVDSVPEVCYNFVALDLQKPYRYFRFLAPKGSFGGNIAEIEIFGRDEKKLSGNLIGYRHCYSGRDLSYVFDGNPLTCYQCNRPDLGEAGQDFK